jgi:trigger factor
MNIVNERQSDTVQELRIEITRNDYAEKVEAALKKQRHKAQIPGFRQGNAPIGLIKKMYGKNLLAEEINDLMSEALYGYIKDNSLDILLEPLPVEEKTKVDFDDEGDFVFTFEYALQPQLEIDYAKLPAVKSFNIVASQNEKDEYLSQLRKRHGDYITPETVEEEDYVSVKYNDIDSFFFVNELSEEGKKAFLGKKIGDEIEISLWKMFAEETSLTKFMKIKEQDLDKENSYSYMLKITTIGRMKPAELNDDFFKKAFPDGNVNNEKELDDFAAEEIEAHWKEETDRHFMNEAIGILLNDIEIEFPDDFVKRYILTTQKGMTKEILEEKYPEYLKSFKWQMIESKLAKDHDIKVTEEEVKEYVRNYFIKSYFSNFNVEFIGDRLNALVNDALKNKEDVKNIYDTLYDKKIEEVLKNNMPLDVQSGDFNDFITFVSGKDNNEEKKNNAAKSITPKTEENDPAIPKTKKTKEPVTEPHEKVSTKKSTKKSE